MNTRVLLSAAHYTISPQDSAPGYVLSFSMHILKELTQKRERDMMYSYSLDGYLAARGTWGAMYQETWVLWQETCGLCTGSTGNGMRLPSEQVENHPV